MKICAHCLQDIEIKSFIENSSTSIDNCSVCERKQTKLIDIKELLDFFVELLNLFEEDEEGENIINLIESDLKIFSSEVSATKILVATATLSNIHFEVSKPVNYKQEIYQNINYWSTLKNSLKWERRYIIEMENIKDLGWDSFFSDFLYFDDTHTFFRSRIHYSESDSAFSNENMFPPERTITNSGRANPQGIPYLYLSKSLRTTFYETRVILHDQVSIGSFKVKTGTKLSIVDFTDSPSIFRGTDDLKNHTKRILLKRLISRDLSKPIRRYDSDIEYIPTQFICEFIKYVIQADGILFNSSLDSEGKNLVVFDPDKMECIGVNKYNVNKLQINYAVAK